MKNAWSVAILVNGLIATSAHADFAYTKWGMTPAEVVAASHGEAMLDSNPETTSTGTVKAVKGTFASGKRRFDSYFGFVSGKLNMVLLTQTEGDCETLREELLDTYGRPPKNLPTLLLEWNDPIKGNTVRYLVDRESCNVIYEPLIGYSPNKL